MCAVLVFQRQEEYPFWSWLHDTWDRDEFGEGNGGSYRAKHRLSVLTMLS